MSAPLILPFRHHDIEMYSDREEDLDALYAELAGEEDDELPPIIVLEPLEPDDDPFWPVAA